MNFPKLPPIEHPEYLKSRPQVVAELQNVINRINRIPYEPAMCMTTRRTGDWKETIITGGMYPDSFVVNIFTQEDEA